MLTRDKAKHIIEKYADAWKTQDASKIAVLFTEDGVYHERVLQKPHVGRKEISAYWASKTKGEQENIRFKLLNVYIDQDTLIAEWDAAFFKKDEQKTVHLQEVAILEIEGESIASLREYWHSERLDDN